MKSRPIIILAAILQALCLILACGGKSELSRSKAEKVIQASDKFTPGEWPAVQPSPDAVRVGLEQGFWSKQQPNMYGESYMGLSPKGKAFFSFFQGYIDREGKPNLTLLRPNPMGRRVVEATGITDGPGIEGTPGTVKVVKFTWKWDWDTAPKEVKLCLGPEPKPSNGEALLKLYDDGWRVEELKVD